jgi:hypothetical protein
VAEHRLPAPKLMRLPRRTDARSVERSSPEERRRVYVILNITVEPLADGALQISGAFGEEPVWEDIGTSRRYSSSANLPRLGFTLISKNGSLETAFHLDHNARGMFSR